MTPTHLSYKSMYIDTHSCKQRQLAKYIVPLIGVHAICIDYYIIACHSNAYRIAYAHIKHQV